MKKLIILFVSLFVFACETPAETPSAKEPTETKETPKEEPKEAPKEEGAGKAEAPKYVAADAPEADLTTMLPDKATEKAPATFKAKFVTTEGDFVVEVTREWAPNGADRFYNMVKMGYFNDIAIFRAIKGFMFQFGIHGNPKVNEKWADATIKDDKNHPKASNTEGFVTFARTGAPDSRSTQIFVNLGNNARLDPTGFTPFGKVVDGKDVLTKINSEYGENRAPNFQGAFTAKGNAYAKMIYPNLSYIKSAALVE